MSKTWNTTEQISTKSWRMWLFCCLFPFGKNEMFPLQYSRTSKQRPTWGKKKVANVETWPLSGGRMVTWQKFKGVQQVYCAKFMLIVSHNGNPIINNGKKNDASFSHLQPMAELRRKQRWDRTSAWKGTLLQPLQSMFWSHLAHPDRWRHKSDRPWNRGLRPLVFSNIVTGSFTSPSN